MDSPDIADIIVTFITETWPGCEAKKELLADYGGDVFAIYVNKHVVGITSGLTFATWNVIKHRATLLEPTSSTFFEEVKYWTQFKAGLNNPRSAQP